MRECSITINNDNTVDVNGVNQYIGEHAATRLVITLNAELCAEDISYYTLVFRIGSGSANPHGIKFSSDAISEASAYGYAHNGIIYFVLLKALTGFSTLGVQVEAHCADENSNVIKTVKSPVFELSFSGSVCGEETIIPEKSFEIIEEMRKALSAVNTYIDEIVIIRKAVSEINNGISEIEAQIDESGVLR